MRELWKLMKGPSLAELEAMSVFERQLAMAEQFNAWMAVGFMTLFPAGLAMLAFAAFKAFTVQP